MSDPLVQQLTRELGVRASAMSGDPAVADRVIRRAHVVRRRRTVAASLTAAVAAAAVILVATGPALRNADSPKPPPATRTNGDTAVPTTGGIRVGYVVTQLLPGGSPASAVLVFGDGTAAGGSSVQLPARWLVQRVVPAGPGLVLSGMVVEDTSGGSVTGSPLIAYATPAGKLTQLRHLTPSAVPTTPDGSTWASISLSPAGDGSYQLDFVRPDTDSVVEHPGAVPTTLLPGLLGAVGPRSLVFADDADERWVWTSGDGTTPHAKLPGSTALWTVDDVSPLGSVLLSNPQGALRLSDAPTTPNDRGSTVFTVTAAPPDTELIRPSLAPDGGIVAASDRSGLEFLEPIRGGVIARGPGVPAGAHVVQTVWEDDRTLLVQEVTLAGVTTLQRCSALSGRCVPVSVPAGQIVLAQSR